MRAETYIKFPCGYEIRFRMRTEIFDFSRVSMDTDDMPICPIHGKSCKHE